MKLYLDDVRIPDKSWTLAKTVRQAKNYLMHNKIVEASFDHDLGICNICTPGKVIIQANIVIIDHIDTICNNKECKCDCHETVYDLIKWLVEMNETVGNYWPINKPKVHSFNIVGKKKMEDLIDKYWR